MVVVVIAVALEAGGGGAMFFFGIVVIVVVELVWLEMEITGVERRGKGVGIHGNSIPEFRV